MFSRTVALPRPLRLEMAESSAPCASSAKLIVMVSRPSPSRMPLKPIKVNESGVTALSFLVHDDDQYHATWLPIEPV